MDKSRKIRRSAVVTLTITGSLAAASCCDRTTPQTERAQRSAWWRFWHNQSWCGGSGGGYHGGYGYMTGSRGSGTTTTSGATARGGFGGSAHGSSGT